MEGMELGEGMKGVQGDERTDVGKERRKHERENDR